MGLEFGHVNQDYLRIKYANKSEVTLHSREIIFMRDFHSASLFRILLPNSCEDLDFILGWGVLQQAVEGKKWRYCLSKSCSQPSPEVMRGGGLGSSTIFKKFHETYAPS